MLSGGYRKPKAEIVASKVTASHSWLTENLAKISSEHKKPKGIFKANGQLTKFAIIEYGLKGL